MVLTPAVIKADLALCHGGHDTAHAALHCQAAAPVLVLVHAAAELQIVPAVGFAADLALTDPILGTHPVSGEEDTRAPSADLLPENVITGGQGLPALAFRAIGEETPRP